MTLTTRLVLSVLALLSFGTIDSSAAQHSLTFTGDVSRNAQFPYLLFTPANYDPHGDERWPLIVYLHGGSARGDDAAKLRGIGLPRRLEREVEFPFIVVSPVCPEGEIWTDVDALAALVDQIVRDYKVDRSRVYLTGHSMGGRGVLYLAYRMPERFAAVAALSPYSPITAWSKRLAAVPLWIIHGAKDVQAPIRDSEELVQATEKAGGRPRFEALADRNHFLLDWYERDDIFQWRAQHRKGGTPGAN